MNEDEVVVNGWLQWSWSEAVVAAMMVAAEVDAVYAEVVVVAIAVRTTEAAEAASRPKGCRISVVRR